MVDMLEVWTVKAVPILMSIAFVIVLIPAWIMVFTYHWAMIFVALPYTIFGVALGIMLFGKERL